MSKSQQRKGKSGEIELRDLLREAGYSVERGASANFGTIPDIVGLPGVHCEVKRVEHLNLNEAMNQSIMDAEKFKDGFPSVFHRKNRSPWLVTMLFSDWLKLYGRWKDAE